MGIPIPWESQRIGSSFWVASNETGNGNNVMGTGMAMAQCKRSPVLNSNMQWQINNEHNLLTVDQLMINYDK